MEITDPDDVEHVRLARLVSATIVYSHDGDLRRPGLAPPRRPDYDLRLAQLDVLSAHREGEAALALLGQLLGIGTHEALRKIASSLRMNLLGLGALLGVGATAAAVAALRDPGRRGQLREKMAPVSDALLTALQHKAEATRLLGATSLNASRHPARIEVAVASLLTRRPDMTMTQIAAELSLTPWVGVYLPSSWLLTRASSGPAAIAGR